LIAVNPYKFLPVYTQAWVKKYVGKRLGILSPHVYAIAESSYSYMVDRKLDVSVLIRFFLLSFFYMVGGEFDVLVFVRFFFFFFL